jgi:hypothetical protein
MSYGDYYEGLRALPSPGEMMEDEGVYALGSYSAATREVDGVVPIPGRNLLRYDRVCYYVTGVVSSAIRDSGMGRSTQEFLLVAGDARLVARASLGRSNGPSVGHRITLKCLFEFVATYDWSAFDLPGEWTGDWRVEQVIHRAHSPGRDYVVDLAAVARRDQ